jgi:hypothetical protein
MKLHAFGFVCCLASPKFRVFQQPARPCGRIPITGCYGTSRRDHSGLIPANFTTFAHFSVSSAINVPNSAGEPTSTVAPRSASRASNQCCSSTPSEIVFQQPARSADAGMRV